ncbi:carboxymuconolactone decarboxylase [Zobellia amurskyensis]|uniref:Carboxymuconolactone decarboxylase n=1 Tax=Zobellia amurskyensis TaxID=248905 RepID=A0A7X2ZTM1_9FLAO|nr:carboxymuconolactone decarboxylase family protein [Zobellia amurskyensis]MUH36176.1 carboxymuconolactone decarboxylase [Zobellia amurskyensis]
MKLKLLSTKPIIRLRNILDTATVLFWVLLFIGFQSNAQELTLNNALSHKENSIIKIASYTAQGDLENLKIALHDGLDNKLTVNQIKEVLVHLYAYAGFPRSIRGLQTFLQVLEDRKNTEILDERGVEASPITDSRDKYDRGKEILETLVGRSLDGPKPAYQEFSPEMDRFLKEHLFADIFERDVLTHKQRELVTISVIASLGTLEPMLKSHLNLSLNVGWQPEQLREFTKVLDGTTTTENAKAAKLILKEVPDNRK